MAFENADLVFKVGASVDGFKDAMSDLSDHTLGVLEKINPVIAGVAAAVVAIGATAFEAAIEFDEAFDSIIAKTGAQGAELEALKGSFETVFSSVPSSSKDVADALSELTRRLDLTGESLTEVTQGALNLARESEESAKPQIVAFTRAMNDWKISTEDLTRAQNIALHVHQETGASITELFNQAAEAGRTFRLLGLSFIETEALLGQLQKTTPDAGEAINSLTKFVKKLADEGKPTVGALQELIANIQNAGSEAEGNRLGIEAFGKAGVKMAEGIREGKFDFEAFVEILKTGKVTVQGTSDQIESLGEKWDILWNKFKTSLAGSGGLMVKPLEGLLDGLIATQTAMKSWGDVPFVDKLNAIGGAISGNPESLVKAFSTLAPHMVTAKKDATEHADTLNQKATPAVEKYTAATRDILKAQSDANDKLAAAQKAYDEVATAVKNGLAPQEALTRAQIALTAAQSAAHPVIKQVTTAQDNLRTSTQILEETLKTYEAQVSAAKKAHELGIAPIEAVREAEQRVKDVLAALHPQWAQQAQDIAATTNVISALPPELNLVATAFQGLLPPPGIPTELSALTDAFKSLGSQSSIALKDAADAAEAAFNALSTSGIATEGDINLAYQHMIESAQKYNDSVKGTTTVTQNETEKQITYWTKVRDKYVDLGQEMPAAQQLTLAALQQQEADYISNSITRWSTLYGDINNGFDNIFKSLNHAVVSGDWAGFVDSVENDLMKMGEDVLTAFVKPAEDAIKRFLTGAITDLLTGTGSLSSLWHTLGSDITGVFNSAGASGALIPGFGGQMPPIGPAGPGVYQGGIPGVGGGAAGGASGAGTSAGGMGGFLGVFNAVTGAVSAVTGVLSLFGVGQEGQKDRLNLISDHTAGTVAALVIPGGIFDSTADTAHTLHMLLDDFSGGGGWFRESMGEVQLAVKASEEKLAFIRNSLLPDVNYWLERIDASTGAFATNLQALGQVITAPIVSLASVVEMGFGRVVEAYNANTHAAQERPLNITLLAQFDGGQITNVVFQRLGDMGIRP